MAIIKDGILLRIEKEDIKDGVYVAPKEVRVIGPYAFSDRDRSQKSPYSYWNMDDLLEVKLPSNVIGIGECAFLGCRSLHKVTATNSLLVIGEFAFENCSNLTSFLIDSQDVDEVKEPFLCTGSQFIDLFGYYEKSSPGYLKVSTIRKGLPEDSDIDWYGVSNMCQEYPLYPGIYSYAFTSSPKINDLQISNKMKILGEEFANVGSVDTISDLKNIVRLYSLSEECRGFDVAIAKSFKKKVDVNRLKIINELKMLELGNVPPKAKILRGLFARFGIMEKKEIATPKNRQASKCTILSEEQYETIIESKITMLEVLEPDMADYFKNKLKEIYDKPASGPSRHLDLSCLYDSLIMLISIIQARNIKQILAEGTIKDDTFKKYAEILLDAKGNLAKLKAKLGNPKIYEELKKDLYATLYEMIKIELTTFQNHTLFDQMGEIDKAYLLSSYAKDIASDPQLIAASLSENEFNLKMLQSFLNKDENNNNVHILTGRFPSNSVLFKLSGEPQTIKIEKGKLVLESFPTIKL